MELILMGARSFSPNEKTDLIFELLKLRVQIQATYFMNLGRY